MSETTVVCKVCGRRCGGPAGLASHMRSMHPRSTPAGDAPPVRDTNRAVDDEMVWEDPPAGGRTSGFFASATPKIEKLRAEPGRWARLYVYPAPSSANTAAGRLKKQFTDCEFSARKMPEGGSGVWGRCKAPA